ncbi:class I SAM-dependent methyltransferase [Halopseudomonas yangmingensis]|uniref:Predicted nicotinamide N-methyase n=1 Tax=Halopseudomonas yangmingensis TaxID=1720063 RepID=A0A1I4SJN1_9GAMM|nr:50S ribosomal protein L11 methyltransferase [Halopseudomonas yangmingensis]SFM64571.1 Predicted nicotinamide N-methyase [Halopseudomonas yangmingensis]
MRVARLEQQLHQVLPDARLQLTALPGLEQLRLWLLDPQNLQRAFSSEETRLLLERPPYWGFCWGSGLALARWVLQHPQQVRGKRVLDFGSGSGVVAIACALAGAACSIACDLDPPALLACALNAEANGVSLALSDDYFRVDGDLDLLIAADVLYDRDNHPLLEHFLQRADRVLLADSRVRDLQHPGLQRLQTLAGQTWPDLGEPLAFREVALYGGV